MSTIRILCLGDIVGIPGRQIVQNQLPQLRATYKPDLIIVNGENSADDGRGITPAIMQNFKELGIDLVTSGNHIWAKREIYAYLAEHRNLLRPVNFPAGCPGAGVVLVPCKGIEVGIINIQGRVFMRELVNCPFRAADTALSFLQAHTNCILVDIHAETTAEKIGLGYYLDGKVSAVVGTHTHVQTADERILSEGTAFITDLGMCGTLNSMIGMKKEVILRSMLTQMPVKFVVETEGPRLLSGVVLEIDSITGKACSIERIRITEE